MQLTDVGQMRALRSQVQSRKITRCKPATPVAYLNVAWAVDLQIQHRANISFNIILIGCDNVLVGVLSRADDGGLSIGKLGCDGIEGSGGVSGERNIGRGDDSEGDNNFWASNLNELFYNSLLQLVKKSVINTKLYFAV